MKIKMMYAYNPLAGNLVFGKENGLPWGSIKEDLMHFQKTTKNSTVVMGAKTFMSLPAKLKDRKNVVIATRYGMIQAQNKDLPDEVVKLDDLSLKSIVSLDLHGDIFFIGGADILNAVKHIATEMHISVIHGHFPGDTFLHHDLAFDSDFMKQFKMTSVVGERVIFYKMTRKEI